MGRFLCWLATARDTVRSTPHTQPISPAAPRRIHHASACPPSLLQACADQVIFNQTSSDRNNFPVQTNHQNMCVHKQRPMAILSVRTEMSMSTSSLSALVLKRSETFTSQYVAQCYPSRNCHKDLTNCNKSTPFKLQQKALCASLLMAVHWSKDGNVGRNPFLSKVGENMGAKTRCSPRTQMQSRRTLA